MDYILVPVDRFLSNRFELLLGSGIVVGIAKEELGFREKGFSKIISEKKTFLGLELRTSLAYYLARSFSVQLGINTTFTNSIKYSEKIVTAPSDNYSYVAPEHKLNFSSLDLLFGFRFHF